jgi:5-methylcytosine-specific restriction endonuclease McrA
MANMNYTLHSPAVSHGLSQPEIEAARLKWLQHPFYASALVLGVDIGLEGIGLCLRRGSEILFAQTVLVELPEASPLAARRANRAARRARVSRKKRELMLKKWIVKYGLLTEARVAEIWHNTAIFQRGFEHRYRAIQKPNALKSPEALVSCIRHCISHRGFDYHLSNDAAFPWGDGMDDAEQIVQWAKRAICPPEAVATWKRIFQEASWSDKGDKWERVMAALDETIKRYQSRPIETHLEAHLREKGHPNLREAARGQNFPRELIKAHLRQICQNHESFFGSGEKLALALAELLGKSDQELCPDSIIDFHRKTRAEVEKLWHRKTKDCPFMPYLTKPGEPAKLKCSPNSSPSIRRFKLLQFLVERTFVTVVDKRLERTYVPAELHAKLAKLLEEDIRDTASELSAVGRKRLGKAQLKSLFSEVTGKRLAGNAVSHNAEFFDQLSEILWPRLTQLKERAGLCELAASRLIDLGWEGVESFAPRAIQANWKETYYQWRRDVSLGGPIFPQVELLLGNPRQYDGEGITKDKNRGRPQEHGILRRLFAGQFRDAHGGLIDLSEKLAGQVVPDYVVLETIGDIPRNKKQRKELQDEQKSKKEWKAKIIAQYGLPKNASSENIKRALLFDQQVGQDGRAVCPYTGEDLGTNPLSPELELEHIFPRELGGISEMVNLVLTKRKTNRDKGKKTPRQVAGEQLGQTKFSSWDEMKSRASTAMKWNKTKRALFCREETSCPEWGNMTRIAQLARQLKDQVVRWLALDPGLDDNQRNNEIARRVGTPSGAMTAACRASWNQSLPDFMAQKKDRSNLRHHLFDAVVVSFIPPGEGMNLALYGGIFMTDFDPQSGWKTSALPSLLPDLQAFNEAHKNRCLVHRPANDKTKTSRYDSTIYSPADDSGHRWTRFKGNLADWRIDPKMTLEEIKQNLRAAGIGPDRLPDKLIERWYRQEVPKGESAEPLRLIPFKEGSPGQKILTISRKATKPCAEPAYGPHYDGQGNIIGWKVAQESFISSTIYAGEVKGKGGLVVRKFFQSRSFHPRHLANLAKRRLADGRMLTLDLRLGAAELREIGLVSEADRLQALAERQISEVEQKLAKKKRATSNGDFFNSPEQSPKLPASPSISLREIYCRPHPIPENAEKIGVFRKGKIFMVPLDGAGKVCKRGRLDRGAKPAGGWWAYRVSAIKTSGEIQLSLAEFEPTKDSDGRPDGLAAATIRPSSADDLAFLLEIQSWLSH